MAQHILHAPPPPSKDIQAVYGTKLLELVKSVQAPFIVSGMLGDRSCEYHFQVKALYTRPNVVQFVGFFFNCQVEREKIYDFENKFFKQAADWYNDRKFSEVEQHKESVAVLSFGERSEDDSGANPCCGKNCSDQCEELDREPVCVFCFEVELGYEGGADGNGDNEPKRRKPSRLDLVEALNLQSFSIKPILALHGIETDIPTGAVFLSGWGNSLWLDHLLVNNPFEKTVISPLTNFSDSWSFDDLASCIEYYKDIRGASKKVDVIEEKLKREKTELANHVAEKINSSNPFEQRELCQLCFKKANLIETLQSRLATAEEELDEALEDDTNCFSDCGSAENFLGKEIEAIIGNLLKEKDFSDRDFYAILMYASAITYK